MNVQVRLFAVARDLAGTDAIDVAVDEPATVKKVSRALVERIPALDRVVAHSILAIDGNLAAGDVEIPPTAEVALIPPVSGG